MPFFVLGHFPFTYVLVYGRKKADKSAQRTLFDTRERQNRNEDSLSLSKELFFLHHRLKKRREEEEAKCTHQQRTTDNEAHYSSR